MGAWTSAQAWQLDGENLFRHKDAYYFMPSENEWYKAGYHKNDGVTANYWDFPTASNAAPTAVPSGVGAGTAAFGTGSTSPANVVASGGLSAYGTMGQGGNLIEWMETAYDGVNDLPLLDDRTTRGGSFQSEVTDLRGDYRVRSSAFGADPFIGFRVASVPEPSAAMLILSGGFAWSLRRRSRAHGGRVAA
jgi:formylglycine-generating enzyme required for sulfatase activity